jgi:hypothetical protein
MIVLSRPFNDNFSFRLFFNLIQKIESPHNAIYLWSSSIDPNIVLENKNENSYRRALLDNIKEDVIFLGIRDHLTSVHFDPWTENKPNMVSYLEDMFNFYPNKKFILLTGLENLDFYLQLNNVKIIPWGGCITNQQIDYLKLDPIIDKNFNSQENFVSLNRNARNHRAALVSLLYGLSLDKHGLISCLFKDNFKNLLDQLNWNFKPNQANIRDIMIDGYSRIQNEKLKINDSQDIYHKNWNDNVYNFKNSLSQYYKNVFIEIVSETSYTERCFNITEKTLNSIYACNFPIFISSMGTVKFLREMGLDVFDDIINHSYDNIDNPIDRMYKAIIDNKELLMNNEKTKLLWKQNTTRFIKNVEFAKKELYTFYVERATNLFKRVYNEFNI